jgi:glycosyltransferase 2 family protein
LARFTSYTIGHNFGGTFFTSGVIRYRVYSGCGLSVIDIAKIAFITGLTYCLGSAFVLGFGIAVVPDAASAFDRLPVEMNRLLGLAALFGLGAYVLWLTPSPRVIGRSNWRITMPGARGTLLQIGIGSLDLTFVALAMYAVLPATPMIDFLNLFVIFAIATLIGVISYVPGSLGVMEAAMFIGLPQFQREDLLASLLTFRLMYFIIPLLLAVALLGLREFRSAVAGFGRAV